MLMASHKMHVNIRIQAAGLVGRLVTLKKAFHRY